MTDNPYDPPCFDGGCLFTDDRTGMRTNGGCHCLENLGLDHRQARVVRMRILGLMQQLKQAKETRT